MQIRQGTYGGQLESSSRLTAGVKSRVRVLMWATVLALLASLALAVVAEAYAHRWSCTRSSGNRCTDFTGQAFNPWKDVQGAVAPAAPEICAKAAGAGGDTKAGSGCSFNTEFRQTCLASSSPDSQAYVYWGGPGGQRNLTGSARTPGDAVC